MKKRLISFFMKSLLLVFSIICALFVAEVFIRLFFSEGNKPGMPGGQLTKGIWRHDDLMGWKQLPNLKSGWMGVPVVTNSKGLRDKEYAYERKPGVTRILVLGDSFVWGWGVKLEDMFTKIIESQRNNLEMITMGTPGYSTDQELLWLEDEGLKYKPDVLLLFFEGGDVGSDSTYIYQGQHKPMFVLKNGKLELTHVPVPDVPIIRKIHIFMRSHSYFYMFLHKRNLTELGKTVFEKITPKPQHESSSSAKSAEMINTTKTNKYSLTLAILRRMHELCVKNKIQFVIVGHRMNHETTGVLEELTKENNILFINLDISLTEFSDANPEKQIRLGDSDCHWTPLGHKIVAETISDYLVKHQLLPTLDY